MSPALRETYRALDQTLRLKFTKSVAADFCQKMADMGVGVNQGPITYNDLHSDWNDDPDYDDDDDEFDVLNDAEALADRHLGHRNAFVSLESATGQSGFPTYSLLFEAPSSRAVRRYLGFRVVQKTDCLLLVAVYLGHEPEPSSIRFTGGAWFGSCRGDEALRARATLLSDEARRMTARPRDSSTTREDVDRRLALWSKWLSVLQEILESRRFNVRFSSLVVDWNRRTAKIRLIGSALSAETRSRIVNCPDDVELYSNSAWEMGDEEVEGALLRGRVLWVNGDSVEIQFEETELPGLQRMGHLPSHGWFVCRAIATDVNRQSTGVKRLKDGKARLENLDAVLFGDNNLRLPEFNCNELIPLSECLNQECINHDQRLALARALRSPDCFFLLGPPGTGKTTFIAEFCFQAARAGKKVLIASQSNLAVDNALGRLQNRREILAIRFGDPSKVDETARAFVGDAAVSRWIESLSSIPPLDIASIEARGIAFDWLWDLRGDLEKWRPDQWKEASGRNGEMLAVIRKRINDLQQIRPAIKNARAALDRLRRSHDKILSDELALKRMSDDIGALDTIGTQRTQFLERRTGVDEVDAFGDRYRRLEAIVKYMTNGRVFDFPWDTSQYARWCNAELQRAEGRTPWESGELRELRRRGGAFYRVLSPWVFFNQWRHYRAILRYLRVLTAEAAKPNGKLAWVHDAIAEEILQLKSTRSQIEVKWIESKRDFGAQVANEPALDELETTARRVGVSVEQSGDRCADAMALIQLHEHELLRLRVLSVKAALREINPIAGQAASTSPRTAREFLEECHRELGPMSLRYWREVVAFDNAWKKFLASSGAHGDKALRSVFDQCANVVGATCSISASQRFLERHPAFDFVVIDEVSKANPTELLLPALLGKRVILVGDHKQLPPFVGIDSEALGFEQTAAELGTTKADVKAAVGRCLFKDRFDSLRGVSSGSRAMMLPMQYRMHSQIMACMNRFYAGGLKMGLASQDSQRQHGIESVAWLSLDAHVVWIDIPSTPDWFSRAEGGTKSSVNPLEADAVARVTLELARAVSDASSASVPQMEIGVISLYAGQMRRINNNLANATRPTPEVWRRLRCRTVDQFQGMERDIIILSLCANGAAPSEFLRQPERVNVAMSRARRLLVIVGSTRTFVDFAGATSHYADALRVAKECGGYVNATDILDAS